MGLFDTIRFHKDDALRCHAGHLLTSFQTKDLDCEMAEYLVYRGITYRRAEVDSEDEGFGYDKVEIGSYGDDNDSYDNCLLLTSTIPAVPFFLNPNIRFYTSCRKCRPILMANEGWGLDRIKEQEIWVEFDGVFEMGKFVKATLVTPDRATLLKQLKNQGSLVIDDDNPIAVAHFYKRENPLYVKD